MNPWERLAVIIAVVLLVLLALSLPFILAPRPGSCPSACAQVAVFPSPGAVNVVLNISIAITLTYGDGSSSPLQAGGGAMPWQGPDAGFVGKAVQAIRYSVTVNPGAATVPPISGTLTVVGSLVLAPAQFVTVDVSGWQAQVPARGAPMPANATTTLVDRTVQASAIEAATTAGLGGGDFRLVFVLQVAGGTPTSILFPSIVFGHGPKPSGPTTVEIIKAIDFTLRSI
jgi:hypothetical protein